MRSLCVDEVEDGVGVDTDELNKNGSALFTAVCVLEEDTE